MALDFDPKKFQSYFEKAAQANLKAWEAQTRYFEGLMKRSTSLFTELADARIQNLQGLTDARNLADAFQSNEGVREKLQNLYEENFKAWEELQSELKEIYALDNAMFEQMQKSTSELMERAKKTVSSLTPATADQGGRAQGPKTASRPRGDKAGSRKKPATAQSAESSSSSPSSPESPPSS